MNRKFKTQIDFDWEPFRQNFRTLLNSRGLTMTDFARNVDFSPGTVTRWLYERTPDILALLVIADYFGVSLDWLLGRGDNPHDTTSPELKQVLQTFPAASDSDKLAISAILSKYEPQ